MFEEEDDTNEFEVQTGASADFGLFEFSSTQESDASLLSQEDKTAAMTGDTEDEESQSLSFTFDSQSQMTQESELDWNALEEEEEKRKGKGKGDGLDQDRPRGGRWSEDDSQSQSQSQSQVDDDLTFENFEDEPLDFSQMELPDHACKYCGIHDPSTVVRCNVKGCGKWFCNGRGMTSGSHIVNHLVRSKHKEICMHKDSPLGETVLECYNCGVKNVFLLGFIPAKEEDVVMIICRDPCASSGSNEQWDVSQWMPIISDRQFLPWLIGEPSDEDSSLSRPIMAEQINKLEELWKFNPEATLEDLEKPGVDVEPDSVELSYEDAYKYQNVFGPLVKLEAEYDRTMKEAQAHSGISVRWERGMNHKQLACFRFPRSESDLKLMAGDELRLRYTSGDPRDSWNCVGTVLKISSTEEVVLELRNSKKTPTSYTEGFQVEFIWKSTSYDRMQKALRSLATNKNSTSSYLYDRLMGTEAEHQGLGTKLPKKFNVEGMPALNISQVQAVKTALQKPLTLIQGPPGTGKTVTSTTIVHHMVKQKSNNSNFKVLVCAPSNVAVDQLAERLHATGLKVVRLAAKSREDIMSNVDFLCLHNMVRNVDLFNGKLQQLMAKKEELGELSRKEQKQFLKVREATENAIIKAADVICCTCVGAGDHRLKNFKFRQVLIDESTQATEPECLIPLVKGSTQIVLVGDHCQLGPIVMCATAGKAGLRQSLFERLVILGEKPVRLQVQYRMHPALSEFPSNTFYEGTLQNGVTMNDRIMEDVAFPWPDEETPMLFYNVSSPEEIGATGTSYLNRGEAMAVLDVVNMFFECGVTPDQIGIVTPYEGQRAHVVTTMAQRGTMRQALYKEIEVQSVDAFQGREKDFIILTCVRSNDKSGIGFLKDARRLNVALTRAKYGVVVIGNARVLAKQVLWNNLLNHFQENNCLVEGSISNLQPYNISLQQPRKYVNRHFLTNSMFSSSNENKVGYADDGIASSSSSSSMMFREQDQAFESDMGFHHGGSMYKQDWYEDDEEEKEGEEEEEEEASTVFLADYGIGESLVSQSGDVGFSGFSMSTQ